MMIHKKGLYHSPSKKQEKKLRNEKILLKNFKTEKSYETSTEHWDTCRCDGALAKEACRLPVFR